MASALIKTEGFFHFDQKQDIASKNTSIGNVLNERGSQVIDRQCVFRQLFGRTLSGFVAVAACAVATGATVLRLVVASLCDSHTTIEEVSGTGFTGIQVCAECPNWRSSEHLDGRVNMGNRKRIGIVELVAGEAAR